jgi:adenylate cyclase class IV
MRAVKQEIEVKLRVADAAEMRRRLRRMGGRVLRRAHEMNTLFDTPQGTLRKGGLFMRLREETSLGNGLGSPRSEEESRAARRSFASLRMTAGRTRYVLTFKGPERRERGRQGAPAASRRYARTRYKVREEM